MSSKLEELVKFSTALSCGNEGLRSFPVQWTECIALGEDARRHRKVLKSPKKVRSKSHHTGGIAANIGP